MLEHARALSRRVVDFCYPGECASCTTAVESGGQLCDACAQKLREMEAAGACEACGMPLERWGAPCPYCMGKGMRPYARVLRLGIYADPLKELIHQMKYQGRWGLGEMLAERLWRQQPRVPDLLAHSDGIVAVPLYRWRQVSRGYNQAEVIAAHLARRSGVRLIHPTRRVRDTATQTLLHSQASRYQNVRGAFRVVRARAVPGKHIVVIDDVRTTGATLRSVGHELRKAGAASLSAIVVAVADPRGRSFQAV